MPTHVMLVHTPERTYDRLKELGNARGLKPETIATQALTQYTTHPDWSDASEINALAAEVKRLKVELARVEGERDRAREFALLCDAEVQRVESGAGSFLVSSDGGLEALRLTPNELQSVVSSALRLFS